MNILYEAALGQTIETIGATYKVSPRGSLVLEASYWLLEVSQWRSLVGGLLLEASCWVPSISGLLWETSYNRNLLMEASYWRRSIGELLRETSYKSSIGTPAWRPSLGGLRGLGRKECPGTVPGLSRDCPRNIPELYLDYPGTVTGGLPWGASYCISV